jgi:ActR/RegA family two-component response regulator
MEKSCKIFMELLRKERFYDAHEVLEEVWFPRRKDPDAKILVLKGFINASVALELLKRGRIENAYKVWRNYEKYRPLVKECEEAVFKEVEEFLERCRVKYLP